MKDRIDGAPIESPLFEPGSTICLDFDRAVIALRTAPNSKVDLLQRKSGQGGADSQFQTDSSIKSQDLSFLQGRNLEAVNDSWLVPETSTDLISGPSGVGSGWDQFEVNRAKFGVKSTYDENLYTKRIDFSSMTAEQIARAERIAREIECTSSSNIHLQEERGQALEQELDEEDRFSGVARGPDVAANAAAGPAGSAWRRGLKITDSAVSPPPALIPAKGKQILKHGAPLALSGSQKHGRGVDNQTALSPIGEGPADSMSQSQAYSQPPTPVAPVSPVLAAPGLTLIHNLDKRSTSSVALAASEETTFHSLPEQPNLVPAPGPTDSSPAQPSLPVSTTGEAHSAETIAETDRSSDPQAESRQTATESAAAEQKETSSAAPASTSEQSLAEGPAASESAAAAASASKLNPKAKEFKFNPNAKEFKAPQPPQIQLQQQLQQPPPHQQLQLSPQQQQQLRMGFPGQPGVMPNEVYMDMNNILLSPQMAAQWAAGGPGLPFEAGPGPGPMGGPRMGMVPSQAPMFQPNPFYPQQEFVMMSQMPMQIQMDYNGEAPIPHPDPDLDLTIFVGSLAAGGAVNPQFGMPLQMQGMNMVGLPGPQPMYIQGSPAMGLPMNMGEYLGPGNVLMMQPQFAGSSYPPMYGQQQVQVQVQQQQQGMYGAGPGMGLQQGGQGQGGGLGPGQGAHLGGQKMGDGLQGGSGHGGRYPNSSSSDSLNRNSSGPRYVSLT